MLEAIYSYATELRNWLFDQELLKSKKMHVPVISVGNLTVGGTGKTPIIQYLGKKFYKKGIKAGIVSRGYGGSYSGVVKVDPQVKNAAKLFGDEPCLLAESTELPVYLCKKRVAAAEAMIQKEGVKLILADDAFQHRWLGRELDIVIMDAQDELTDYQLMPFGRLRESLDAIKRADVIILNKINLVSEQQISLIKKFIKDLSKRFDISPLLLEGRYQIKSWMNLQGHGVLMGQKKVLLLSGLAQPKAFEALVLDGFYVEIVKHFSYPDHFVYTAKNLSQIIDLLRSDEQLVVLTTTKDAVKLKELDIEFKSRFYVSELSVELDKKELLIEKINRLIS